MPVAMSIAHSSNVICAPANQALSALHLGASTVYNDFCIPKCPDREVKEGEKDLEKFLQS
jgi:hypothetical protein